MANISGLLVALPASLVELVPPLVFAPLGRNIVKHLVRAMSVRGSAYRLPLSVNYAAIR